MSDEQLIAFTALAALFVFFAILLVVRLRPTRRPIPLDPDKYIIVDGSNVMHWGGEPSVLVLTRVLAALVNAGLTPIVYFDANVGYKLWDRHANAQSAAKKLGLDPRVVIVAPSGVTADELLLEAAVDNGLRVVTNDRFLDWRVEYPKAGKKGFLVKGEWRQGSVMLRGL
jgi:hypothetical protein